VINKLKIFFRIDFTLAITLDYQKYIYMYNNHRHNRFYYNNTDIDNKLIAYCDNKVKSETNVAAILFKKAKLYYII